MINRLEPNLPSPPEITLRISQPRSASRWNGGQWLGLAGAALMFLGVWLPVFQLGRGVTLLALDADVGGGLLFAPTLLGLTLVAAIAAARHWSLVLGLVGLASYATLAMAWLVADSAHPLPLTFEPGWVVLMLGAMLLLAAAAIEEYLSHRDRKISPIDLQFEFPALARRHSLPALQSGWELRN